ncbi:acetyltransferase [Rhodococcoides kroppenstedtii]|uniref:acetyltransferase n=1 Tax=Rhodococcoides kroppenstedtii TaxID=293050 RepID=UPI0028E7CF70|nr:acetyltransferase [Rhodococcus kroppenstedtii]
MTAVGAGRRLVLLAASGLAREVLSTVRAGDADEVVAVLDDDPGLSGVRVGSTAIVGTTSAAASFTDCHFVICAGSGAARVAIATRLASLGIGTDRFATIVHPSVDVPDGCRVGNGSILLPHTAITADIRIGQHVVVMPNVTLTHDCVVEDYATLCAGATLGGGVRIGRGATLGMASSVREHRRVGRGAVLGMGAVALEDVPDHQTRVGCPARPITPATRGAA